jgi:hypothetical protein
LAANAKSSAWMPVNLIAGLPAAPPPRIGIVRMFCVAVLET